MNIVEDGTAYHYHQTPTPDMLSRSRLSYSERGLPPLMSSHRYCRALAHRTYLDLLLPAIKKPRIVNPMKQRTSSPACNPKILDINELHPSLP